MELGTTVSYNTSGQLTSMLNILQSQMSYTKVDVSVENPTRSTHFTAIYFTHEHSAAAELTTFEINF